MLFSDPDYPVFLIAVFFLYGLARWGGPQMVWARLAVMVLLGDVVFMLVAKDPDVLWDPIGGTLLRLAAGRGNDWPPWLIAQFVIGGALLATAIAVGRRHAEWIASERGQRKIAVGMVVVIVAIGGLAIGAQLRPTAESSVALSADWPTWFIKYLRPRSPLDQVTRFLIEHGHLLVIGILGIGLGASREHKTPLGRVVVLFVVSALFYHAWAAAMPGLYRYLLFLLLGTIVLDYYLGLWIERASSQSKRKALVIVSLCSNLGILFFFKYYDFFVQHVLGAAVPSVADNAEVLNLILPAGISFHTFQSLSYTIDVYRGELKATKSAVEFATFVLFFPQLVAGPIVRAQDLLPQLGNPPALDLQRATDGLFRVVVGLFKKIAVADTLALTIVDPVFGDPTVFSSVEVMAAVYGYALQIYLDFSAYSDIAIGSAMILGFDLPENFRTPYRSGNIQEFWRRWHISLSTWLRDYLYITLGGSRGAEWRTYVNLSLTMLLGGLWHGASWTFIVWGALHGFGLAITRYFQRSTSHQGRMLALCAVIAAAGVTGLYGDFVPDDTWTQIIVAWIALTPLWAVLTAWLGEDLKLGPVIVRDSSLATLDRAVPVPLFDRGVLSELLRILMCISCCVFLFGLRYFENWTWIPLVLLTWALGVAADVVDRGAGNWVAGLVAIVRRAIAVVLVFHYVCFAWIFFRAAPSPNRPEETAFDNALAILRQLGDGSTDHPNVTPIVTCGLAVGFATHFFADGGFAWLRRRFIQLSMPMRGLLLVGVCLVLRELAHHDIVKFIYFQF